MADWIRDRVAYPFRGADGVDSKLNVYAAVDRDRHERSKIVMEDGPGNEGHSVSDPRFQKEVIAALCSQMKDFPPEDADWYSRDAKGGIAPIDVSVSVVHREDPAFEHWKRGGEFNVHNESAARSSFSAGQEVKETTLSTHEMGADEARAVEYAFGSQGLEPPSQEAAPDPGETERQQNPENIQDYDLSQESIGF